MKLPLLLISVTTIQHLNDVDICTDATGWAYAPCWSRIERFKSTLANLTLNTGMTVNTYKMVENQRPTADLVNIASRDLTWIKTILLFRVIQFPILQWLAELKPTQLECNGETKQT